MNKKLVFGFLDDNLTSIQRQSLEQWLKDPANEEDFYSYLHEYEKENKQYDVDVETKLVEVKERFMNVASGKPESPKHDWTYARKWKVGFAAAMVIMLLGVFFNNYHTKNKLFDSASLLSPDEGEIERINNSSVPQTVILPDNSSVILQPGAKINYSSEDFKKRKRVVFFEGVGFFEVQKDPKAPFVVNTPDFSTRVLGTSFSIKTAEQSSENEVIVKTGRVAVFKSEEAKGSGQAIFLSANEKIHFPKGSTKPLVSVGVTDSGIKDKADSVSFGFDERPVSEVFEMFASVYHVNIDYDKEEMKNCKITAFLQDEPLYEKIRLICFALDAKFEFKGNTIIIMSNGCE